LLDWGRDVSIVIPVYREDGIDGFIRHIHRIDRERRAEVIVVDGDPGRTTITQVTDGSVTTLTSDKGRARQMNAGAAVARGRALLFLHADTHLPSGAISRVMETLADPKTAAGAFDIAFDDCSWRYGICSAVASWRARLTGLPFGDQAIFMRRKDFQGLGGFSDVPIMEDVDLMSRVRSGGGRVKLLPERVVTSARRLQKEGQLFCLARSLVMLGLYRVGISPHRLSRYYGDAHRLDDRSQDATAQDSPPARAADARPLAATPDSPNRR